MKEQMPSHVDSVQLEILENIKEKLKNRGKVLDVGGGDGNSSVLFDENWEWICVDKNSNSPKVLKGDIHKLDFKDQEFDLVLCIAVLDRVHRPWIAIKEVSRVLNKDGFFFGTVAFLEPDNGASYFHMTQRGLSKLLEMGDLEIIKILPNDNWTYLNLHLGAIVAPDEPENNLGWDLAFHRFHIRTNSGLSGNGKGGAYVDSTNTWDNASYDSLIEVPEISFFETDTGN